MKQNDDTSQNIDEELLNRLRSFSFNPSTTNNETHIPNRYLNKELSLISDKRNILYEETRVSHKSTSALGQYDARKFNLNIECYDNIEMFRKMCNIYEPSKKLDNIDQIESIDEKQRLQIDISRVIENNELCVNSRNETRVDKLLETILRISGFDSDNFSIEIPKNMRLRFRNQYLSSNADRHVVFDGNILLTAESKHIKSSTYKKGELQLICHMLASLQHNAANMKYDDIWGIRIVSCECHIYCIRYNEEYLRDLKSKKLNRQITVIKYPYSNLRRSLNLVYPIRCCEMINILLSIRESISKK